MKRALQLCDRSGLHIPGAIVIGGDEAAALDLNFASWKALGPLVTFTRGSVATYTDATVLIQTAGLHVPRFDHDPVTHLCRGLLMEEGRTNFASWSADLSNAAWNVTVGVTRVPNAEAAPDGTSAATKLTATASDAYVGQRTPSTAGGVWTFAVWLRAAVPTTLSIFLAELGGGNTAQVCHVTPQWQRFSVTRTALLSAQIGGQIGGAATFSVGEEVFAWGAQLEPGAFATSYIPTTTAATRAADVARIGGAAFSSWFNGAAGTFLADCYVPASGSDTSSTLRGVLTIAEATGTTNRMSIGYRYAGQGFAQSVVAYASEFQLTPALPARPARMRFAFAYSSGSSGLSINGAAAATSAAPMDTAALRERMLIAASDATANQQITIARLRYWRRRMSDAELVRLSSL